MTMACNSCRCARAKLGNTQSAITDYDKAIGLNADYVLAHLNRAYAYNKPGDWPLAMEAYKSAAKLGDKTAQDFLRGKGITW
jgi:Tfp pilus assembly protein PilF